jgi:hypothetical protein
LKEPLAAENIHSAKNMIELPAEVHTKISRFYSSKYTRLTGKGFSTVRDWMNTLSYEDQAMWGRKIADHFLYGKPL